MMDKLIIKTKILVKSIHPINFNKLKEIDVIKKSNYI